MAIEEKECFYPECGKLTTSAFKGMPLCWEHLMLFAGEGRLYWEKKKSLWERIKDLWPEHHGHSMRGEPTKMPLKWLIYSAFLLCLSIAVIIPVLIQAVIVDLKGISLLSAMMGGTIFLIQMLSYEVYWKKGHNGWLETTKGKIHFWAINIVGLVLLILGLIGWFGG